MGGPTGYEEERDDNDDAKPAAAAPALFLYQYKLLYVAAPSRLAAEESIAAHLEDYDALESWDPEYLCKVPPDEMVEFSSYHLPSSMGHVARLTLDFPARPRGNRDPQPGAAWACFLAEAADWAAVLPQGNVLNTEDWG